VINLSNSFKKVRESLRVHGKARQKCEERRGVQAKTCTTESDAGLAFSVVEAGGGVGHLNAAAPMLWVMGVA